MRATYDGKVDAMYIALEDAKPKSVKQTIALNDDIIVDFDANKKIVGTEILSASKNLTKREIKHLSRVGA